MQNIEKSKLKALSDIASIDISLEFKDILQSILKISCEAACAQSGTIMLVDEPDNNIRMVASYGLPQNYIERVYDAAKKAGVPLTSSPSGTVLETGKCYPVPNIFEEPKDKPWYDLSKELGFSSQIFTPMKKGLSVIGLLNIYWAEPRRFTDEEIDFVTIAASQASSVVQNARLCGRLENNVLELRQYKENLEEKIKETHKKLYESEAKYRELFDNANDGIYTHDVEGYFQTINDAGLKILRCATKEEVIGSHISKWLTPESFEVAKEVIKKYVSGELVKQPISLEIICKNGEHVWVEFRNRIIKEGNRIVAIHGIGRDITEKRRMEQQLKEYHEELKKSYEELKEADRMKNEFISNITHELLTPLTSIKGFVELLTDETIGMINEEQKKSLGIILRNSERLIHLIKELLDVSRLEKNTLGLQFGLVSINDILSKCILDMQPMAKEKQISLFQDFRLLPRIWGDEERLIQVIINLLTNAIKFTPQNGKITVISHEFSEQVKISIRDTGIGIPKDELSRIFDRFYQIDSSAKRKYGGTGIGLSICKNIIEKHYGSVWAESDGNGSTFHILLPKLKSKAGVCQC